jgi:aerobic-type carbon monoxide dehydrogenase small subunit (CoxS/CutS family)
MWRLRRPPRQTQIRSCVTLVAGVVGHEVTTLEGLSALAPKQQAFAQEKCARAEKA